jgi:hypothetical protein
MRALTVIVVLAFSWGATAYPKRPDTRLTPGALCSQRDADFAGYRYGQRIAYCERNVSGSTKQRIFNKYGIPLSCKHLYTIDHFYPLSIGGNNTEENLWPEHRSVKALRPHLETEVYEAVRSGQMKQAQALAIIEDAKLNPPVKNLTPGNPCAPIL